MVGAIPWSVERSGGESSERGAVHACNRAIASRVHGHRHQGDGCGSVHGDSCGSGGGPGHRRDACRCGGRASSVPGAGRTRPDSVRRSSAAARLSERGACRGVATFVDVARSDGRSAIPAIVRARQVTCVKPALAHEERPFGWDSGVPLREPRQEPPERGLCGTAPSFHSGQPSKALVHSFPPYQVYIILLIGTKICRSSSRRHHAGGRFRTVVRDTNSQPETPRRPQQPHPGITPQSHRPTDRSRPHPPTASACPATQKRPAIPSGIAGRSGTAHRVTRPVQPTQLTA